MYFEKTRGIVIDSFAGGGGASTGIEAALGRSIDVAINHNPEAVAVHMANHPGTRHYCKNVWQADPESVVREAGGGPVALAWFSPDCKHFSKAKGGKPVKRNIRDLAWIVVLWARRVRPLVIMLENVEEFREWGPVDMDGHPCPDRKGETFDRWISELRRLGYRIDWRELRACDYGAPTIRKRLFLIARRDGLPIVWPEPTHGSPDHPDVIAGLKAPWRTAADIIDWGIPCTSIFNRAKPIAENTLRRIAKGIVRYVIDTPRPYIVPSPGGLIVPHMSRYHGKSVGSAAADPVQTLETKDTVSMVAAFLAQHNGGMIGHRADDPVSTITQRGTQQAVVASHLVKLRGTCRDGQPVDRPMPTITAGGMHVAEVRAFLIKYYGTAFGQQISAPLGTVTTRDRFGLVTVVVDGVSYVLADIGMRMLSPRELFRAQGFPEEYDISPELNGRPLTKTAQIALAGNSVCPPIAEALVRANVMQRVVGKEMAA